MKKRNKMIRGIVLVGISVVVVLVFILVYKRLRPMEMAEPDVMKKPIKKLQVDLNDDRKIEQPYVENQVLAIADSKREANNIAKSIGGELISYDNQVAIIQIGITVEEMMERLETDASLPKVYPNYQNYTTN